MIPFVDYVEGSIQSMQGDITNLKKNQQDISSSSEKLKQHVDNGLLANAAKIDQLLKEVKEIKEQRTDLHVEQNLHHTTEHVTTGNDENEELEDQQDINVLDPDFFAHGIRITPYTGGGDITSSTWLRKFEDYVDAQSRPWTDKQKAQKLKFFLDGLPREEYESLIDDEKDSFSKTVEKLKEIFESPKMRNLGRRN
ncbi:unnamed protein product [Gongylonema pulchrum]|uniref:Retrotrans_gag domain-containing protein n=1 Tax=Gongylonema pulchrum TaxID=637853 RepID=A0A183EBH6_9BILA|nr:unnamed protein product [Gongylonema pulchrum]